MDTIGALALATEPPDEERLLAQRPHGKTERIISNRMALNIVVQALYQILVMLLILFEGWKIWAPALVFSSRQHFTIIFNSFVFCQFFNFWNCRLVGDSINVFHRVQHSPMFIIATILVVAIQAVMVEVGGVVLQVEPLTWSMWLFCIAIGLVTIPLGIVLRLIPVPEAHIVDILFRRTPPVLRPVRCIETMEDGVRVYEADMTTAPPQPAARFWRRRRRTLR